MFDTLTAKLDGTFKKRAPAASCIRSSRQRPDDMRTALLEADVALEVADAFLGRVRTRALSEEVMASPRRPSKRSRSFGTSCRRRWVASTRFVVPRLGGPW